MGGEIVLEGGFTVCSHYALQLGKRFFFCHTGFWDFNLLCNTVSPSHRDNVFWILQAVHNEMISCVQLLLEREKKKFNTTFKKINKQLGKEKKLLNMNKTKGLIREHEVRDPFLFCSLISLSLRIVLPTPASFSGCSSLCLWNRTLMLYKQRTEATKIISNYFIDFLTADSGLFISYLLFP